jgi:ligand-binding SRPBCC domain-containing protein
MIRIQRAGRGLYRLEAALEVPGRIEDHFSFFADAANLQRITPKWLDFRIVTPEPIEMGEGTLIDYRLKVHGIPFRWRSRISVWEPPHRFVDEQIRGPYRRWYHEHRFVQQGDRVRLEDEVTYAVPGGALAHGLFVRRDLERIFAHRLQELERRFGAAGNPSVTAGAGAGAGADALA